MAEYQARVTVRAKPAVLDPEGQAILQRLPVLDLHQVQNVRVGKIIWLSLQAESAEAAERMADKAARQLLANPVMETYEIDVSPL